MISGLLGDVGMLGRVTEVREVFLRELGREGAPARVGAGIWERAGTIAVRRDWPKATGAGKILPFALKR